MILAATHETSQDMSYLVPVAGFALLAVVAICVTGFMCFDRWLEYKENGGD